MATTIFLILFTSLATCTCVLGLSCPNNSYLSEYIQKLENATEDVITDIQSIVLASGNVSHGATPNATTLYTALTAAIHIPATTVGLSNFSVALDVITEAYFKACYGSADERPNSGDGPGILSEFLSLLHNRTDVFRMRELFGKLSCLQNFTHSSHDHLSKRELSPVDLQVCADAMNMNSLYACLETDDQLDCIFNLNNPINCTNANEDNQGPKDKKHCLAFAVDTTGSMGEEISHARQVIQHFIQSEENTLTLCYVLVPFNDYDYSGWPNLGNLDYGRIYDASYHSNDMSDAPLFKMTDSSIVVRGVNDLLTDVNNLTAVGGGDCPEYGMTAMLKAMELIDGINTNRDKVQTEGRHNLIVLTDASAKDNSLYQTVSDTANADDKPDVTVHFFYSGNGCSGDGFGNYEDIKEATGGYSVQQINAAKFQQFADFIIGSYDDESRKKRSSPALCQYFQISEFVKRFSSLLETSSSSIVITKPDGSTETIATFANSFAVYKVTNPQTGNWKACVTASYTLQHSLSTTVGIDLNIDYLKESENGELLPTTQFPFACDTHKLTITTSDLTKISLQNSLYLDLIDNNGNILQYVELSECAGYLSGSVTIPTGLVQYQLRGLDSGGTPFAHIVPNSFVTFKNALLQIVIQGSQTVVLNPGGGSLVRISIQNIKNGPKNLTVSTSVTVQSGVQVQFLTNPLVAILPQQEAKVLQFILTSPATLSYEQELIWSISAVDTCTSTQFMVNYTAVVKQSIPFNVTSTSASMISFEWSPPSDSNVSNYTLTLDYTNGTIATVTVSGDTNIYNVQGLYPYQQVYASILAYTTSGETAEIAPISVLTDESEPGPVSRLSTNSLSMCSVRLSWSLPQQKNGIILYYELFIAGVYNEKHNSSINSVTVNGLEPYRRYTAIVRAATSVGKGQPMSVQFYSLEGVPIRSPQYTNHTITSPTSVTVQWAPPLVKYRNGFIQHYTVLIEADTEGIHTYTTQYNRVNISGVAIFADLNVSISASTSAGQGPLSEPFVIHIVTGVSSAPHNFSGAASSRTSVLLNWISPESPNGRIIHYQLYYKVSEGLYEVWNFITSCGQNNSYLVENLESGIIYHFIIAAVNFAGRGENSTEIQISLPSHGINSLAVILPVVGLMIIAVVLSVSVTAVLIYCWRTKAEGKLRYLTGKEDIDTNSNEDDVAIRQQGFVEKKVEYYEDLEQK